MKRIELKNFGTILSGRDEGQKVYEIIKSELMHENSLIIDISDVDILNPSYADEVIVRIMKECPNSVSVIGTPSLAVRKSLETLEDINNIKILN